MISHQAELLLQDQPEVKGQSFKLGNETRCEFLTLRHDAMHGHRQEEDGVAVVGPRAGAEVLLHGLHDGEQLLRKRGHVVE